MPWRWLRKRQKREGEIPPSLCLKSLLKGQLKVHSEGVLTTFLFINPEARVTENEEMNGQILGGSLAAARGEKAKPCSRRCSVAAGRREKRILKSRHAGKRRVGAAGPRVAQGLVDPKTLWDLFKNLGGNRFCRDSEVGNFGANRKPKSRMKRSKVKTLPAPARVPFLRGKRAEARMSEYSAPVQLLESLTEKMQKRLQVPRRKTNSHDADKTSFDEPAKLPPAGAREAKLQPTSTTNTTHGGVAPIRKVQPGSSESGNSVRMQLEGAAETPINVAKGRGIGGTAMGVMRMATARQEVDEATDAEVAKWRNPEFRT